MSVEFIRLEPGPGRSLRDLLFDRGVEFPCGGVSNCGACKVRVLQGEVPITPPMRETLTEAELAAGWRLGCKAVSTGPVTLEIAQWSVHVLDDQQAVAFEPSSGLGLVVDVGTTTLVAQLVDRSTGQVLAVETALNPQARHGADLMSRIHHELAAAPGELTRLVRQGVGSMVERLAAGRPITECLLVGNTAMHHLFAGRSVEPLAHVPFRSPWLGPQHLDARELGWNVRLDAPVCFLPCIGGFVGSDLLAGIVATGLDDRDEPSGLLDLGTNGEIAVGSRSGVRCASTAAGPAFEGGRIGSGMRAGTGAIDRVSVRDGTLDCHVIGSTIPRGLCGSGLVDAVAAALDLGWIRRNGRLAPDRKTLPLAGTVSLTQADVRELQLAKAALAAGFELLLDGHSLDPHRVFLAGAFGNYIQAASARRIGLLPAWAGAPVPAGNSALRGARMLLLAGPRRDAILDRSLARCTHLELASAPMFQDTYVDHMAFPAPAGGRAS